MKTLIKTRKELESIGRWDIDFHLPAEGIKKFPRDLLKRVDQVATLAKEKRDPTKTPDSVFQYIDISSVDVAVGQITNPQEVDGIDAPSRARKVVRAFDIVVSTCRPTRGAIAVVPVQLHSQIASTGFSIVRPNDEVNPFYLHYALRLPSTLEQFRKWSTGSSYPAILDDDVKKTLIPMPERDVQDAIAEKVMGALREREKVVRAANAVWLATLDGITASMSGQEIDPIQLEDEIEETNNFTISAVRAILNKLRPLSSNSSGDEETSET
jgi:hypothetical protein